MESKEKVQDGCIQIFGRSIKLHEPGFWREGAIMKIRDGYIPTDVFIGGILTITGIITTAVTITGFNTSWDSMAQYYSESEFRLQVMRPAFMIALFEIAGFLIEDFCKFYRLSRRINSNSFLNIDIIYEFVRDKRDIEDLWGFANKVYKRNRNDE